MLTNSKMTNQVPFNLAKLVPFTTKQLTIMTNRKRILTVVKIHIAVFWVMTAGKSATTFLGNILSPTLR
jgi:hypothetical protein